MIKPRALIRAGFTLLAICCLGMQSCGKRATAEEDQEGEKAASTSKAKAEWDWNQYSRSKELVLGTKSVAIQPKRSLEIKSESSGVLTVLLDKEVVQVAKGHLWAEMDKIQLERQKEKMDIQETKSKLTLMKQKKFTNPEKIKNAEKELEEARKKVALIKRALGSRKLKYEASKLLGIDLSEINKKGLREAEEEISLKEQMLTTILEVDTVLDAGSERIQELDLIKSQEDFLENKKKNNYTAPFSGELRLELDFIEGETEYTVASREVIGTLNDYSEMHVLLSALNDSWVNLDNESLYVQLSDRNKTKAIFKESKVLKNNKTRREEKYYVFALKSKKQHYLQSLSGTSMQAKLITKLETRAWIVPKLDVALEARGKSSNKAWSDIVDDIWPGARLLAEGDKSLAIDYLPARRARSEKGGNK